MLPKTAFSKIPSTPPPPITNDDFDFQFESPSLSTEINSVPPTTDGGTQENETTQEMSFNSPPPATRTSKRIEKPTQAFLESVEQQDLEFHDFHRDEYIPQTCAFNANIVSTPAYYQALHQDDFKLQDDLSDPIAFLATTDGDTLHYGQAMKA